MFPLILLYLVLTIIRPQEYVPALIGVPVLPVVLILAFAFWLPSAQKTYAAPQFLILPIFLAVIMASQVANGWFGGAIKQLNQFGPTVIAFFVLAAACTQPRRLVIAMAVTVLCTTVLAIHGIEQARDGIGWTGALPSLDGRIQYVGIFNDPNDLGLLFVSNIPFCFYLSRKGGFLGRIFWLACAALILYGIKLTNSRGAMLAVLVIFGAYVWYRRGLLTAGTLGAIGLIGMKMLSSRMQDLDAGEESANGRVDAWYEGLHMFTSHPVFGVGAGNFTEHNPLTAHNSLVLVLAETGFVGYILWLAFVCYSFWMMLSVLRFKPEPADDAAQLETWRQEKPLALTLLLTLCGLFAAAFFLSRSYMVVMYLIIAMVTGHYIGTRQRLPGLRYFNLASEWWRWVPAAVGSIACLFVMVAVLLKTVG